MTTDQRSVVMAVYVAVYAEVNVDEFFERTRGLTSRPLLFLPTKKPQPEGLDFHDHRSTICGYRGVCGCVCGGKYG